MDHFQMDHCIISEGLIIKYLHESLGITTLAKAYGNRTQYPLTGWFKGVNEDFKGGVHRYKKGL